MRRVVVIALIFMLGLSSCALAVGKITVDPNSDSNPAWVGRIKNEELTAKKVSYEARHKSVKSILAELSKMTGVELAAGVNDSDWQVRDRKMNIFAKDIPLADLMDSIARVMKFKWSVNKETEVWSYRLFLDRKTLLAASAENARARKEYEKEATRRRSDLAAIIDSYGDLSPGELEKLKQESPYLYLLQVTGRMAALQGLFKDAPGMKEAFINQNAMRIPISALSPETQALVLAAVKKRCLLKGYVSEGDGAPFPDDAESGFGAGSIEWGSATSSYTSSDEQHRLFGSVGVNVGDRYYRMAALREPSDPSIRHMANVELEAYEKDVSVLEILDRDVSSGLQDKCHIEQHKADASIEAILLPQRNRADQQDEPALHKKIKLKIDKDRGYDLADYEPMIAEASGFALVSDSFKYQRSGLDISDSEIELKEVLNIIADGNRYNWNKHENIIELWSAEWFKKRMNQIPDEWVDDWKSKSKRLGYLDLDSYSQIGCLTVAQVEENIWTTEELTNVDLPDDRDKLRFYASLNTQQRKSMFASKGMALQILNSNQRELLGKIFSRTSDESNTLRCSVLTREKLAPQYIFTVTDGTDAELGKWSIVLPKYVEPRKANQGCK